MSGCTIEWCIKCGKKNLCSETEHYPKCKNGYETSDYFYSREGITLCKECGKCGSPRSRFSRKAAEVTKSVELNKRQLGSPASAALEKPLLAKRNFYTKEGDINQYYLCISYENVVAAVKKHKARKFYSCMILEECPRCRKNFSMFDTKTHICRDCAIEQDFGKVE